MATTLNYDEIYEKWDELEDAKTRLVPGESMWAKKVGNGLLGLNNSPLDENFRWQDIIGADGTVVHRRWNTKVRYYYDAEKDEASRREALFEMLKPVGHPGFFMASMGYVLVKDADAEAVRAKIVELFSDLDFETNIEPLWSLQGLPDPDEAASGEA